MPDVTTPRAAEMVERVRQALAREDIAYSKDATGILYVRLARAALHALGLLNGTHVVVPVEATEAMLRDGAAALRDFYSAPGPYPRTKAIWTAMLAASPGKENGDGVSQEGGK